MDKSKRNGLAGKSTGKSESAKYFASHPEAKAKKMHTIKLTMQLLKEKHIELH